VIGGISAGRAAAAASVGGIAAAAGSVIGLVAERAVMGYVLDVDDPYTQESFGGLRGTPYAVETSDAVQLHVEVDDSGAVGPTVVFAHGYALNQDCWHFQRRDLGDVGTLVFYDQRSHGRSGRSGREEVSITRLGIDLGEVLDAVAPPGPVVLVGHSMGGMSIMALADQRPDLFGERVRGVALIATGADQVVERLLGVRGELGRTLGRRVGEAGTAVVAAASRQADLIDSVRRSGSDLGYVLTRRLAFARADIAPSLVELTVGMLAGTPVGVIADFLPHFVLHDTTAALAALARTEALVIGAVRDHVTPIQHSRDILTLVPHGEYLEIPDAGHMVMLEYPDLVTAHLRALVARASRGTAVEIEHPGAVPVPLPRPTRRSRRTRTRRR
jgi:pimeloyl-ACP methyl ester carboxylesterase